MTQFNNTAASKVDTSQADEKPLNATDVLHKVFQIFSVQMGVSEKTGRDWGLMKVYAEEDFCLNGYLPNGKEIWVPRQVWMTPHMIYQARQFAPKDYPVEATLIQNDRGGYELAGPDVLESIRENASF